MNDQLSIYFSWITDHFWNFLGSFLALIFLYFTQIRGAVHIMFFAFLIDLILGVIASVHIRKEKFSMDKLFKAFYRFSIALVIVMLLFANDIENGQDFINLYRTSAWLITGFIIVSAARNAYDITGGPLLLMLSSIITKKLEEMPGYPPEETKEEEK